MPSPILVCEGSDNCDGLIDASDFCFWMRANKILLCLWDGQLDYRRHVDAFQ
jgi:hypothetical protein